MWCVACINLKYVFVSVLSNVLCLLGDACVCVFSPSPFCSWSPKTANLLCQAFILYLSGEQTSTVSGENNNHQPHHHNLDRSYPTICSPVLNWVLSLVFIRTIFLWSRILFWTAGVCGRSLSRRFQRIQGGLEGREGEERNERKGRGDRVQAFSLPSENSPSTFFIFPRVSWLPPGLLFPRRLGWSVAWCPWHCCVPFPVSLKSLKCIQFFLFKKKVFVII